MLYKIEMPPISSIYNKNNARKKNFFSQTFLNKRRIFEKKKILLKQFIYEET